MDWLSGPAAPVLLIEHSDGKEFGTGFAVHQDAAACWLVTCAHVVDARPGASLCVEGRPAEVVADGRAAGRAERIDLAVLRVPGLAVGRVLPLAPQRGQPDCTVLGWSKYTQEGYSLDRLGASVVRDFGHRDRGSTLTAHGFRLRVASGRLEKGHSGAPAICNGTEAVFAVVFTEDEQGGSTGGAICISHLLGLWPDMPEPLRTALDSGALGPDFAQETAALLTALAGPDRRALAALYRRSVAPGPPLALPDGESSAGLVQWLLDQPRLANGRHPLYEVLRHLRARPGLDGPMGARLEAALRQLQAHYGPDLVTDPLPPPPPAPLPGLFEIVFEPLGGSEFRDYEVHSHWHPPSGEPPQVGPGRERDSGGRLDLCTRDQVGAFVGELFDLLADLPVDAGPAVVFQFRAPHALLLHPFEHWPEDDETGVTLGRDYPVVVAARERGGPAVRRCRELWARLAADLHEPLCERRWCPEGARVPTDPRRRKALIDGLDAAPCVVLTATPDPADPHRWALLELLLARGIPVALWPRTAQAEPGLCDCLDRELGDTPIAGLPHALCERRRQAAGDGDAHPLWAHLTLLWDDPGRSAVRRASGRFLRGLG